MYSTPLTPVTPAPAAQASPAPQDELDALINRAVSGYYAPYYTPQEVSADDADLHGHRVEEGPWLTAWSCRIN